MSGGYDDDYDAGADEVGHEPSQEEAAEGAGRVLVPGILMIITGVINLVLGIVLCVVGVGMSSMPDDQLQAVLDQKPEQRSGWTSWAGASPTSKRSISSGAAAVGWWRSPVRC